LLVAPRGTEPREQWEMTMTDTTIITIEFLALLLQQIEAVYRHNTNDFCSICALDLAIAAIEADENMNERSAETILENMSHLAHCMLGNSGFSPAIRARLETIRYTHPDFAERPPRTQAEIEGDAGCPF
jgi:aerobic-type carbon monoxide dehydrogenase small subunit (CoxS/CutS family)